MDTKKIDTIQFENIGEGEVKLIHKKPGEGLFPSLYNYYLENYNMLNILHYSTAKSDGAIKNIIANLIKKITIDNGDDCQVNLGECGEVIYEFSNDKTLAFYESEGQFNSNTFRDVVNSGRFFDLIIIDELKFIKQADVKIIQDLSAILNKKTIILSLYKNTFFE